MGCPGCRQIPVCRISSEILAHQRHALTSTLYQAHVRTWAVHTHSPPAKPNFSTYLGNSVLDHLLIRHIALVANQELVHTLGSISVNLLKPLLDIVERVHVGDIVDNANTVSTAVVGGGDGSESLLASSVPLC